MMVKFLGPNHPCGVGPHDLLPSQNLIKQCLWLTLVPNSNLYGYCCVRMQKVYDYLDEETEQRAIQD
jgi:hypothetical protein